MFLSLSLPLIIVVRLCVIGQGDPTLNSTHLEQISEKIESIGIKLIKEAIYDDFYFDNKIPETWEWGDLQVDDVSIRFLPVFFFHQLI